MLARLELEQDDRIRAVAAPPVALTLTQPVQIWVDTSINLAELGTPPQFYRVTPNQ
jgi:hypothetical protein